MAKVYVSGATAIAAKSPNAAKNFTQGPRVIIIIHNQAFPAFKQGT